MEIQTFYDWIIIEPIKKKEENSVGPYAGIYFPETINKSGISQGKVLSSINSEINVEDIILYKKSNADLLEWEGKELFIIKFENIIGKVVNEKSNIPF